MNKRLYLLLISLIMLIILLPFESQEAFADTTTDQQMYNDGISNGTIDSSISFDVWEKANSHPSPPIDADPGYTLPTSPPMGSTFKTLSMASGTGLYIKKGDILITDGTSLGGFTGHAAILTTSNWVLDIPDFNSTTRQTGIKKWLDQYTKSGSHVWVYRLSPAYSNIASNAADWADTHYYSSTGSSIQDIRPTYLVTTNMTSVDPTYCSKIPFQAYYYGSGNLPVMDYLPIDLYSHVVAPYDLISHFQSPYTPSLIYTVTSPTGWLEINDKWYYYSASGSPLYNWQLIGNSWYYLDPSTGEMATGWKYLNGQWYYLNPGNISGYATGAMVTGWQFIGGYWYYLNPNTGASIPQGAMQTGWLSLGGYWYYLNPGNISGYPTGAMVTGTQTINGTVYNFDSSGRMIS